MIYLRQILKIALASSLVMLSITGCSSMGASNTVALATQLSSANEVPSNASTGGGSVEATLNKDTNLLTWTVTFSGLTGPALMAHFHGPAASGMNAGVALPIAGTMSPLVGQATLTPAQAADLLAGKWYVNVHTAANKGGEVRGQMMPKM
jgi:hypothetical protein